jgi:hypothetical protein
MAPLYCHAAERNVELLLGEIATILVCDQFCGEWPIQNAFLVLAMSSYVEMAIESREKIPEMCVETLKVINKMDQAVVGIERAMDGTLNDIKNCERVTKRKVEQLIVAKDLAKQISDMKAQMAVANYDLLDHNIRMVDEEIGIIEKAMLSSGNERLRKAVSGRFTTAGGDSHSVSIGGGGGVGHGSGSGDVWGVDFDDIVDNNISNVDPNEPVYCYCRQVAYGEMIACDNEECSVEWFHYPCVNLSKQPRNKWMCPDCTRAAKR